jgi:hypothetical protein
MSQEILPEATKLCVDCARPIPSNARRCGNDQCGAFQDWRRFTGGPLSLVTLATSLGVLLSLILNVYQIRDLAEKPSKEEATQIAKESVQSLKGLSESLRAEELKLLAVPAEWEARYETFLKDPEAGIIKLLPRGKYEDVMKMRGAGAYYSFVKREQEYGRGSDIELQDGQFEVGFAGLDYGFFVPLAGMPIQDVVDAGATAPNRLDSAVRTAWAYAWDYTPPPMVKDLRCEQRQFGSGRGVGNTTVIDHVTAQEGHTFLLRSISPRDSDVLVAVRAEKRLEDGSFVLVWRRLKTFPVPRTEGPEPETVCQT